MPELTARDSSLATILRWYRRHGRHALPWRTTRDPYAIFISEAMLQQTQVDRVLPFYRAWLIQFPDWHSLARATTDALVRAWAGLGYNRRALYVRSAARAVVELGTPNTIEKWRALPGMGPYASAAVHGFTTRMFVPAIDTNVRRVIGRAFLGIPFPSAADDPKIARFFALSTTKQMPWTLTYALMDFGAAICVAKRPQCASCPLRAACRARIAIARVESAPVVAPRNARRRAFTGERIHNGKHFPDRIFRGRILALVRMRGRVPEREIGSLVDPTFQKKNDASWMRAIIDRLIRDRFLERVRGSISIVAS